MPKEQEQQTMEEYLLSQLDEPVMIQVKDSTGRPTGETTTLKAPDGHVMTKQEAIATNILNLAMKGDGTFRRHRGTGAAVYPDGLRRLV